MKKIILLALLLLLIASSGWYLFIFSSNPQIYPDNTYTDSLSAEYIFPFKDTSITLSISVPASIYHGAKDTGSKYLPYTKITTRKYYADFTNDPLQEDMYAQILTQTETVKQTLDLTEDEYLELLSTFVQSIHYNTKAEYRYPVETIIDKYGDCDDKSILLAGLLIRAGYDAVLLIFDEESHAAVGIKTSDMTAYPDSGGYAVIETTDYSYITDRSFQFEDGSSLSSTPAVVSVGSGAKTYTSGSQITFILNYRDKAAYQIDQLSLEGAEKTENLDEMQGALMEYEIRLSSLESLMKAKISAYNAYVELADSILSRQKTLNKDLHADKITYDAYSSEWETLNASYTEYLNKVDDAYQEYTDYHTQYQTLYSEYQKYYSKYTAAYTDYSSKIGEQNRHIDIYNLIISEPYNREYVYQTVLHAPVL
ncbi:hypothetical protein SDC9_17462 [bioreactor metagenome]|uniref:Transglutaminase-like domain-containing protein n=1 Tax=bioreactor metagenome TaxID=1076179 RepID=A0A644TXI5_9ZZZZ|nr:hypothetical protein [Methanocorpusculum sp.]